MLRQQYMAVKAFDVLIKPNKQSSQIDKDYFAVRVPNCKREPMPTKPFVPIESRLPSVASN
jgi:hypothetical protein